MTGLIHCGASDGGRPVLDKEARAGSGGHCSLSSGGRAGQSDGTVSACSGLCHGPAADFMAAAPYLAAAVLQVSVCRDRGTLRIPC